MDTYTRPSVITETGGTDVLEVRDVPMLSLGPGDMLVDVTASAVNHTDVWIRRGAECPPPIVTGTDVAAEVVDVGGGVECFEGGERVVIHWNTTYCGECEYCQDGETTLCRDYGDLGVKRDGGHAEYVALDAAFAVELPDDADFVTAATVPSNFATAWHALFTHADLKRGGASGGVGNAVVQIAAEAGATVYAASSSAWKASKLRDLEADRVIDYTETDVDEPIRNRTDGRGVDVVLESVGGETYEQAVRRLTRGGRLVSIGATTGDADSAMLQHLSWKQLEFLVSTGATMAEFTDMPDAVFAGDVSPVIDWEMGLAEIPDAHDRLERCEGFGNIIMRL